MHSIRQVCYTEAMGIHTIHYSEVVNYDGTPEEGDLVDIDYFCSGICQDIVLTDLLMFPEDAGIAGKGPSADGATFLSWGGWPGGSETDYDVFCAACGCHLWHGLQCPAECVDPDEDGVG